MGDGIIAGNKNVITKDVLAEIKTFLFGRKVCISPKGGYNFNITYTNKKATIGKGFLYVYGYCGFLSEPISFDFVNANTEQNWFIYAEMDTSIYPNTFSIKRINNGRSIERTFRQDSLFSGQNGVYQKPLWIVTVKRNGIVSVTDLREIGDYYAKRIVTIYIPFSSITNEYVYTNYNIDSVTGMFSFDDNNKISKNNIQTGVTYYIPSSSYDIYAIKKTNMLVLNCKYDHIVSTCGHPENNSKIKNVYNCESAKELSGIGATIQPQVTVSGTLDDGDNSNKVAYTLFVKNEIQRNL